MMNRQRRKFCAPKFQRYVRFCHPILFKSLVLTFPALLITICLCEILVRYSKLAPGVHALRVNSPHSSYKVSKNPILIYELKENYRDDNPDFFDRLPRTNSHGQRDRERSWIKPNGVQRIVVLGDSVTVGDEIRDLNDTIPGQLELMLQGTNTEVLNFGVAGYCTRSEVELLKVKGLKYQPDLVIVIFVRNDYKYTQQVGISMQADDVDSNAASDRLWVSGRPAAIEKLFVSSHMFRYVSLKTNLYGFRDQFESSRLPLLNSFEGFDNNVREGLKLLMTLSDEHEFKTMIAIWPSFTKTAIVDKHPVSPDDPDRLIIERIAEEYGIPAFRLSRYFQKHYLMLGSELKEECPSAHSYYSFDGMHPNETGAKIAAEALMSILRSHTDMID